ncbi:hypothetical protein J7L09_02770 [bacterium]|nr:hypothetical protein [bacterium]
MSFIILLSVCVLWLLAGALFLVLVCAIIPFFLIALCLSLLLDELEVTIGDRVVELSLRKTVTRFIKKITDRKYNKVKQTVKHWLEED